MALRRTTRLSAILALMVTGAGGPGVRVVEAQAEPAIADNSFLIEEAYNQEPGVVQHISSFTVAGRRDRDLHYAFTQEWPFLSQRHQLSFTVPVSRPEGGSGGVGDVMVHYRQQVGAGSRRWALAPRLSAILPTGSVPRGLGDGSVGLQANLPLSYRLTSDVITHWNAGATILPWAKGPVIGGSRVRRTITHYNLGASVIAPTRAPVQVLLEQVLLFEGRIGDDGQLGWDRSWIVSPGVRAAVNLGSLQVIPGVAVPFTRAGGRTERDFLAYLSFEHPFRSSSGGEGAPAITE